MPQGPKNVVAVLRGHWIVMLKHVGSLIIGWSLFGVLLWFAFLVRSTSSGMAMVLVIIATGVLMAAHHILFIRVFEWILSNVFITNQLIIDLHYLSFSEDDVAYIEVSKINEVEKRKHGIWRNILNYGEVVLSVAGMSTNPTFQYVSHPSSAVALIEELKEHP